MAKVKEIQYPTQEWLENWVDGWLEAHPTEKVSDFAELTAKAEDAWWIQEIDRDHPTPFDLTPEQEKASKEARKGMAHTFEKRKTPVKRERKPNADKQEIIQTLDEALCDLVDNVTVVNKERTIDFEYNGVHYSINLIAHRPPKGAE